MQQAKTQIWHRHAGILYGILCGILTLVTAGVTAAVWLMAFPDHDPSRTSDDLTPLHHEAMEAMRKDVQVLSVAIGPRNSGRYPENLRRAGAYIEGRLRGMGYGITLVPVTADGHQSWNILAEPDGPRPSRTAVLIGAHYDSFQDSPGADDNASGVAVMLWLAGQLAREAGRMAVSFAAFTNEEPPYFRTEAMGSAVLARRLPSMQRRVSTMISIDGAGYFVKGLHTQRYPEPFGLFYDSEGDFIGFVTSLKHRRLAGDLLTWFRKVSAFPSGALALPGMYDAQGQSDDWSFARAGVPAALVTDTAFFRNPFYHTRDDILQTLDFGAMSQVAVGFLRVIGRMTGVEAKPLSGSPAVHNDNRRGT